jgi:hypothetical protein
VDPAETTSTFGTHSVTLSGMINHSNIRQPTTWALNPLQKINEYRMAFVVMAGHIQRSLRRGGTMRRHRKDALRAAAAVSALALLGGCLTDTGHDTPSVNSKAPTWSVQLPPDWGAVRAAQLVGDTVVVQTGFDVAALRKVDGSILWHQPATGGDGDRIYLTSDSVILVSETGRSPAVRSFDLAGGQPRWSHAVTGQQGSVAVTTAGIAVLTCQSGGSCALEGIDTENGRTRWQHPAAGVRLIPAPAATARGATADPSISDYATPFQPTGTGTVLLTTQLGTGTGISALDVGTGQSGGPLPPTPADLRVQPVDARRYLAWNAADKDCPLAIAGHDTSSGAQVWSATVGQWSAIATTSFDRLTCDAAWTPVIAAGRLLAMSVDEKPEVIDVSRGSITWRGTAASVLLGVAGNTAILRGNHGLGDLSAVDLTTGRRLWNSRTVQQLLTRVAVTDDRITYTTTTSTSGTVAHLTSVDARTGAAWTADGSNQLAGTGPGWVLGSTGGQGLNDPGPANLRLFLT